MRFVDISSDMIRVFTGTTVESFPRNGVETVFGPRLVQLYRDYPTDQILVLNGPGGFTNLRVGGLALTLLNTLHDAKISYYSLTKIDLFKMLVEQGFLPSQGAIYLGQKHNIWRYDFEQMMSTQLRIESLPTQGIPYFVDFVSDASYWNNHQSQMLDIQYTDNQLLCTFAGKTVSLAVSNLLKQASPIVTPEYFVEAI